MNLSLRMVHFTPSDFSALAVLALAWLVSGFVIDSPPKRHPSVAVLMSRYRRDWMVQMVARDPRIFDAQTLSSLRQGTAFFASASMIAIGGCLALMGNLERLIGIAGDLTRETSPAVVWEIKLLVVLFFLVNAFLKFVWANRLFGYCAVLMASVPNDPGDAIALPRARKAGEINITAARSFNRGLRSLYFSLAALAWLIGPVVLMLAVCVTSVVLLRREFASQSRKILMQDEHTQL